MNDKINSASRKNDSSIVLGVMAGMDRYLIPIEEIQEVIALQKITSVPLTQSWFLGLMNVRGNLYGITDLGAYLNKKPTTHSSKSRVLLISSEKLFNGFIVNSMLGIRNLSEFVSKSLINEENARKGIDRLVDADGKFWQKLSLYKLMSDKKFTRATVS
ncbi:MAG: chemotaxis protein CheW [Nitrosomonas sp.]|nr:MAG: chemotaxis protein CheW [Nitrosomonas sp.]